MNPFTAALERAEVALTELYGCLNDIELKCRVRDPSKTAEETLREILERVKQARERAVRGSKP